MTTPIECAVFDYFILGAAVCERRNSNVRASGPLTLPPFVKEDILATSRH